MNIVKKIDQYNENYIYFCEPIKNNIMNEGSFIRIIYSTPQFVLNGIYLLVILNDIISEKYYNKYKCCFNINTHIELIKNLKIIEENILKKIDIKNKTPQFKIYEQLQLGNLKIFNEIIIKNHCVFTLKISGIWETKNNYGLTYKFIKNNESFF
jgi:hypothetical protein